MEKGIIVLSLFDGCSGGQQALDRLGIKVDNYYASEIDKYAIQVTMANYPNTVFITNGKSVLSEKQERALLKVEAKRDINTPKNEIVKYHFVEANEMIDKTEIPIFPAKTVNDLARLKFKEQLLKEIMFDLMVCEIENWDKKEYINELKKMLNSIDTSNKKKVTAQNLPDLFSSFGF